MDNLWFGDVYSKYYSKLKLTLMLRRLNEESAEDVISKTAIALLKNKDLKQDGAISLFTNSVRLNASKLSKFEKNTKNRPKNFDIILHSNPETDLLAKEELIHLYTKIDSLPNDQKRNVYSRLNGTSDKNTDCTYAFSLLRLKLKMKRFTETKQNVAFATKGE